MKKRIWFIIGIVLLVAVMLTGVVLAVSELEPNDTPAQANTLSPGALMEGAVNPTGDQDYFALGGINTGWGFIALLETDQSITSQQGSLTALRHDGVTVLQSDSGSWEHGSGIALQNYADGSSSLFLRVTEQGNDATISTYNLRYYTTVISTQPEIEPNGTRLTGTPSSFTHAGVIDPAADRDCFAFHGRVDDDFILALNSDPEGDGSPVDLAMDLVDPADQVVKTANLSGLGGKEFIEQVDLLAEGAYAYCIYRVSGTAGPTATYKAGLVRNAGLYRPAYIRKPEWLNPGTTGTTRVGDTLSFRLAITNTSPLAIPGYINFVAEFSSACLAYLDAVPAPSGTYPEQVQWYQMKNGLAVDETYSVEVNFRAIHSCVDGIHQSTNLEYYFTGHGDNVEYTILPTLFLPVVRRN
jgi:hypothetical protein